MWEELQQANRQWLIRYRIMQWVFLLVAVLALFNVHADTAARAEDREALARKAQLDARRLLARQGPILDRHRHDLMRPVQEGDRGWRRLFPWGPVMAQLLLTGNLTEEQRATGYRGTWLENLIYGSPAWASGPAPPLVTNLDARLATSVYQRLIAENTPGCIIVLKPDGELLCLVDAPGVDPERYYRDGGYIKQLNKRRDDPLFPRSLSRPAVGSVVKPIIAALLLERGMPPDFTVRCRGRIFVNGRWIHCITRSGHGRVGVRTALAHSCNVFFWTAGRRFLDQKTVLDCFYRTGILDPDVRGLPIRPAVVPLPGTDEETWLFTLIGQHSQLPLLGIARAYACLMDGRRPKLRVITDPPQWQAVFQPATCAIVRQGLADAVLYGTARSVREGPGGRWRPICKTGSAEVKEGLTHSLACLVAPGPSAPAQIIVLVFLEGGGRGTRAAALGGEIIDLWFRERAFGRGAARTATPGLMNDDPVVRVTPVPPPSASPADILPLPADQRAHPRAPQRSDNSESPPGLPRGRLAADERWVHVLLRQRPQQVVCYRGDQMVRRLICSGSRLGTDDWGWCRTGSRKKRLWFRGNKKTKTPPGWMWWWVTIEPDTLSGEARVRIRGRNGLHAVPAHGRKLLGQPASHGCLRLRPSDARWFWRWASPGTPLYFQTRTPDSPRKLLAELRARDRVMPIRASRPL
jgi:transpeptidase family protein/L,D-transpeptidase-like protein